MPSRSGVPQSGRQHRGRQGEWGVLDTNGVERGAPMGHFLTCDGTFMTPDRGLAGPLRFATEPRVGPRGGSVEAADSVRSDMGLDRISPRGMDPMAWPVRMPQQPSGLLSTHIRDKVSPGANMMRAGEKSRDRRP